MQLGDHQLPAPAVVVHSECAAQRREGVVDRAAWMPDTVPSSDELSVTGATQYSAASRHGPDPESCCLAGQHVSAGQHDVARTADLLLAPSARRAGAPERLGWPPVDHRGHKIFCSACNLLG
jgi:hypothetical protein